KKLVLDLADGLLAHRKKDDSGRYRLFATVRYQTDEDAVAPLDRVWPVLWAAWRWTGDRKYLLPFLDEGPRSLGMISSDALDQMGTRHDVLKTCGRTQSNVSNVSTQGSDAALHLRWQITEDERLLESLYASQIEVSALREYINTLGSLWIDRVGLPYTELQRARLGGIALIRNSYYPGHSVSWSFQSPANEESVAILIPYATPQAIKVMVYNLGDSPVQAKMTAWDVEPGKWEIASTAGDDKAKQT